MPLTCCEEMKRAQEVDTDNIPPRLLSYWELSDFKGHFMGAGLPPIKFCPWCGTKTELYQFEGVRP